MSRIFELIKPISRRGKIFCKNHDCLEKEYFKLETSFPSYFIIIKESNDNCGSKYETPFGNCLIFDRWKIMRFIYNIPNINKEELMGFLKENMTGVFKKYNKEIIKYFKEIKEQSQKTTDKFLKDLKIKIIEEFESLDYDICLWSWDGE